MNCNQNSGGAVRMPEAQQIQAGHHMQMSAPAMTGGDMAFGSGRFPVGMGYVPMQRWETPYPIEHGFMRGTIFPSLDYPFMMGGCRRWQR